MKATSKTILYTRVVMNKIAHQHPVAVFGDEPTAKTYAMLINTAHKTGNREMALQLDPKTVLTESGDLVPGIKFSLVTVPYSPSFADAGDDLFADDRPAAS